MKDILKIISEFRINRNWTEYELAERAGLPQSTISSWYRKNVIPSVASLEKVCCALGITLSQLFAEKDEAICLTAEQSKLLDLWNGLEPNEKEGILYLMERL